MSPILTRRATRAAVARRPAVVVAGRVLRRQQVLEAVLAQAVVERRAVDAERARRAGDVALRCVDGGDDLVALLLVQALAAAAARRRVGARRRRGAARRPAPAAGGAAPEVEVGGGDLGAAREDDRALDDVLELAHVARPGVAGQRGHAPRRRGRAPCLPVARRELLRRSARPARGMSLGAIAQRRQRDREDVEPVVEVLAELAVGDQLLEVAVGRRDDAHVDLDRLGAADALELALLQHAQQLDLHLHRQVAAPRRGTACRRRPARSAPAAAPPRR